MAMAINEGRDTMRPDTQYRDVSVPDDKPPTEYTATERRAEILAMIVEPAHPLAQDSTPLAVRYGCSPSVVQTDIRAIRTEVVDTEHDVSDLVDQG